MNGQVTGCELTPVIDVKQKGAVVNRQILFSLDVKLALVKYFAIKDPIDLFLLYLKLALDIFMAMGFPITSYDRF